MIPVTFTSKVGTATVKSDPALRLIDLATGAYRKPSASTYDVLATLSVGPGTVGQYQNAVAEAGLLIMDAGQPALLLARNATYTALQAGAPTTHVIQITEDGQPVGSPISLTF